MSKQLTTKAVRELLPFNFLVDEYQRGYKWTAQQVLELLNDIDQYNNNEEAFYCLQPLAVRELSEVQKLKHFAADATDCYEVIDGQQRLTTAYLVLTYLGEKCHGIEYQTRAKSAEFLADINTKLADVNVAFSEKLEDTNKLIMEAWHNFVKANEGYNNIDNYHFFSAYLTIKAWFAHKEEYSTTLKSDFHQKLTEHTRFIWFQDKSNDDSKVVFRNLNSGKIGLTNAELIKALFINSKRHANKEIHELQQNTFASEWDEIEQTLQNNDFWFFINNSTDDNRYQTRIDFLFEIIIKEPNKNNDKLFTYHQFANKPEYLNWDKVKRHFQKLKEWYNNNEWYHLIGYIIDRKIKTVANLIKISGVAEESASLTKKAFTEELKNIIQLRFNDIEKDDDNKVILKIKDAYNLDTINYEDNYSQIVDVLLLFNICQYQKQISGIRFPFKSFKNTKWTLEHIHAQNTDEIETIGEIRAFIRDITPFLLDPQNNSSEWQDMETQEVIMKALKELKTKIEILDDHDQIKHEVKAMLTSVDEQIKYHLKVHALNNMALLDGPTNSGLGKKPFPKKRDYIIDKNNDTSPDAPYIPLTTVNVFLKYYTKGVKQYNYWGYQDRSDYLNEIKETLQPYLKA